VKFSYINRKLVGPRKGLNYTEDSLFWYPLKRDITVQVKWATGCICNVGNGDADNLPRPGSKQLLVGPELACGISERIAK